MEFDDVGGISLVKLIALFRTPEDKDAFNSHYHHVHLPLAGKMPGLERLEVTRIVGTPMSSESEYYVMAEMYFASDEALRQAMASPEGRAGAKDLMGFAGPLVSMFVGEVV